MTAIDRRAMLRAVLSCAAVASTGLALIPGTAEAAPLALSPEDAVELGNPAEQALFITRRWGRPSRHPPTKSPKCSYKHGKRVCSTAYHR
jgi:hypothetical protein